jgi:hypothetical protein
MKTRKLKSHLLYTPLLILTTYFKLNGKKKHRATFNLIKKISKKVLIFVKEFSVV